MFSGMSHTTYTFVRRDRFNSTRPLASTVKRRYARYIVLLLPDAGTALFAVDNWPDTTKYLNLAGVFCVSVGRTAVPKYLYLEIFPEQQDQRFDDYKDQLRKLVAEVEVVRFLRDWALADYRALSPHHINTHMLD